MADRGGGAIVNVASIDGVFPAPGEAAYGSTKAALVSLTETMAIEYGTYGVRINAVAPSLINTRLVSRHLQNEEQYQARASFFPINRVGEPEDVAAAIVFLVTDVAGWISGVTIKVAGGQQASSDIFRWVRRANPVPGSEWIQRAARSGSPTRASRRPSSPPALFHQVEAARERIRVGRPQHRLGDTLRRRER